MDQEQQDGQQPRWQPTRKQVLWVGGIATLAFLLIVICGYLFGWKWTGLPKQTLWDWLKLLVVPAVIAGGGIWFNRQQRERELEIASQQRDQELEIAEGRTQDEALQAYLDQMSNMLIPTNEQSSPSLYETQPGDSLRSVARARTLTVLPRLDEHRKVYVVQFLYESGLIDGAHPVLVDLRGADLRGVYLTGAYMYETNLRGVNLSGAVLEQARLTGVILRDAYLVGTRLHRAALRYTPLEGAYLNGALLEGASLHNAYLSRADLSRAYLKEADLTWATMDEANLSEADLTGAQVNEQQLRSAASLEGATMPDGQTLRGSETPHGPTFEDWLKDKEAREEDVENE